jgi:GNAT superfamily N-acetyltransferase
MASGDGVSCNAALAWDNRSCEGTAHCPPRCPRWFDRHGEPVLVRSVEEVDRAGLVEMYEAFGRGDRTLGVPPESSEDIEDWLDALASRGWGLVARQDGDTVGHVAVVQYPDDDPEAAVFVHPDRRARGIGTELLKQAIARAAAREEDGIELVVDPANRRARSVFADLGFEAVEEWNLEIHLRLSTDSEIAGDVRKPPAEWDV